MGRTRSWPGPSPLRSRCATHGLSEFYLAHQRRAARRRPSCRAAGRTLTPGPGARRAQAGQSGTVRPLSRVRATWRTRRSTARARRSFGNRTGGSSTQAGVSAACSAQLVLAAMYGGRDSGGGISVSSGRGWVDLVPVVGVRPRRSRGRRRSRRGSAGRGAPGHRGEVDVADQPRHRAPALSSR